MERDDLTKREEKIRELAHRMWINAGRPEGQHEDFWHKAEAEIDAESSTNNRGRTVPRNTPERS